VKSPLPPDARVAIDDAIEEYESPGCEIEYTDRVVIRGTQTFAVFGDRAYDLNIPERIADENGTEFEYHPVTRHGKLIACYPPEGRGGVLYLFRKIRDRGVACDRDWDCVPISLGWIRENELAQSNAQIARNILAELDEGILQVHL